MLHWLICGGNESSAHVCSLRCLDPLAFDTEAAGVLVALSQENRLASRVGQTFQHGLVFSNRAVRVSERVCLRVESCRLVWHGALRVGFTNVRPRSTTLPPLAIPDLLDIPGHWAATVPEEYCSQGAELEFWVNSNGSVYVKTANDGKHRLLVGVDLSRPLWALMDVYGQTSTIRLLGSKKKDWLGIRKSCPVPLKHSRTCVDQYLYVRPNLVRRGPPDNHPSMHLDTPRQKQPPGPGSVEECVVCMNREACVLLCCGHQCLCLRCACKVVEKFGSCPICRKQITDFHFTKPSSGHSTHSAS